MFNQREIQNANDQLVIKILKLRKGALSSRQGRTNSSLFNKESSSFRQKQEASLMSRGSSRSAKSMGSKRSQSVKSNRSSKGGIVNIKKMQTPIFANRQ